MLFLIILDVLSSTPLFWRGGGVIFVICSFYEKGYSYILDWMYSKTVLFKRLNYQLRLYPCIHLYCNLNRPIVYMWSLNRDVLLLIETTKSINMLSGYSFMPNLNKHLNYNHVFVAWYKLRLMAQVNTYFSLYFLNNFHFIKHLHVSWFYRRIWQQKFLIRQFPTSMHVDIDYIYVYVK